jgi:hypothetical protein
MLPFAANLLRMFDRAHFRHPIAAALTVLCALVLAAPAIAGRPSVRPQLESAPEWLRLAALWQTMLDHSSDVVYSPTRFRELAKDIDAIDVDLAALVKRGLLPRPISSGLARLFHARYSYLLEHHYTEESDITVTDIEAAVVTAQWVVELQLAAIRQASRGQEAERKTIAGAEDTIVWELSFLQEYEAFKGEAEKRRQALADRQAAGENVDFRPFESERIRRSLNLLDAYRSRRIPISRSVRELMPYLVSLTTLTGPTTPSSPVPGG